MAFEKTEVLMAVEIAVEVVASPAGTDALVKGRT